MTELEEYKEACAYWENRAIAAEESLARSSEQIAQAVAHERERCAKIDEPWPGFPTTEPNDYDMRLTITEKAVIQMRVEIAVAIRAPVSGSTEAGK